jgi:hypothetical protein
MKTQNMDRDTVVREVMLAHQLSHQFSSTEQIGGTVVFLA